MWFLFIYFWPHWVFVASCGWQGLLSVVVGGLSLQWLLLLWSTGSRREDGLLKSWCTGLVALQHVKSSQTRDWTCVPCLGKQILIHWAAREVPAWADFLVSLYTHTPLILFLWLVQNVSGGRASACVVAGFRLRQLKNKYISPQWDFISFSFTWTDDYSSHKQKVAFISCVLQFYS